MRFDTLLQDIVNNCSPSSMQASWKWVNLNGTFMHREEGGRCKVALGVSHQQCVVEPNTTCICLSAPRSACICNIVLHTATAVNMSLTCLFILLFSKYTFHHCTMGCLGSSECVRAKLVTNSSKIQGFFLAF